MDNYHCAVHGTITDVMKMAFDSSILRDPATHAYTRIERIYCIACYVAFLDQQLGEVALLATEGEGQKEVSSD